MDKAMQEAIDVATAKAEIAIQDILTELQDDLEMRVDQVNVDTRDLGQLRTEIFLKAITR